MGERLRNLLLLSILIVQSYHSYTQGTKVDSLSELLKEATSDTGRIDVLNELAFNYIHVDPLIARDDVQIALEASQMLGYKAGEALALNVMGGIEWATGNYEQALKFYLQSLKEHEQLGDELTTAMIYNNIGEIHKKLNNTHQSLFYLLKAKKVLEEYGHETLTYVNLGEIHLMMENYDSALYYYQKALVSNRMKRNEKYEAYAHHGIAEVKLAEEHLEDALENALKALRLRDKTRDHRGSCYTHLLLGKIYSRLNQKDSADYFLNKALKESQAISAPDIQMNILETKAGIFAVSSSYDSAYSYYMQYTSLKDSLFDEEKSNQIARMQTAYETEILKKENEASSIKLKQRNTLIITIIMLFILSAAVAGGLYKQRKVQQTANELLAGKNKKIRKQSEKINNQAEKLRKLNDNLESLNQNLEDKVKSRTRLLKDQNKLLAAYAHSNAHELRAPLASVMGLVDLLKRSRLTQEEKEIVEHLIKSATELDVVIRDIRQRLEGNDDFLFID